MSATLARLVRQVRRHVDPQADVGDAALLAQWVDHADHNAFELLLWRHGPMVWQTCRRVLRHDHDAEDAFQAAFLTLARKAASVRRSDSLAGWLYRVAFRAALAARGRKPEAEALGDLDDVADARRDDAELRGRIDEEIRRLPPRYREAFVLCCLQGHTTDEAAETLGCPRGTVGTRVAWARRRLRERLGRDVPCLLCGAPLSGPLVEAAMKTVTEDATPVVAELCREVMTMLLIHKIKTAFAWIAPVLIVAAGFGAVGMTGVRAEKPAAEKKKPNADKPKSDKKPDANKPAGPDVQGIIKSAVNEGKLLTIVTKPKDKNSDEQTVEIKLTDKTQALFFGVGTGGTEVKEGQGVSIWFAENSKDTAARAHFHGDKNAKGAKPSLAGPLSAVADDGKSITVVIKPKKKNEEAVVQTVKINDKTGVTFANVEAGGAKLATEMQVSVWLAEGSDDVAARVTAWGKAELPGGKKGGEGAAHVGQVSAIDKDGKSVTITVASKTKGEEPKQVALKLTDKSKLVFSGVGAGAAKIVLGQTATVWVDQAAIGTVAAAHFQAAPKVAPGVAGKVTAVADDAKSFTVQVPPTKKNEEGKEVTIKVGDKSRVIFNGVAAGAAKITKGYAVRVEYAEGSKDLAALVTFGQGK